MSHRFHGSLCGYLCSHCTEPLSNVLIRLYRPAPDGDSTGLVDANVKDTLGFVDDDAVGAKANRLIVEGRTDGEGRFSLELSDKQYRDGPFEVDVVCLTVPRLKDGGPSAGPVQFTLTTLKPEWVDDQQGLAWQWDHCITQRFWCAVRAHFGAWTICGHATDCETGVGVAGLTVTAFDADWFQHDNLGSDVTDGTGHYRIDYLESDFKETPFSPAINIEWVGGPDLFFKIESGGITLLDEDPSRGRQPDRENSRPCACVDLCVEGQMPPVDNPLFTHIGDFHVYGDIDPVSGLTNKAFFGHGGPDFGFFGSLKLKGFCPKTEPGPSTAPMSYRFLYVHPDNPGVPVPITGPALVAPVVVGARLIQWKVTSNVFEWAFQSIVVAGSGGTPGPTPQPAGPGPWGSPPAHVIEPDANGWVAVDPNGLDDGFYGPLLRFNSGAAVPGGSAPGDGAGTAVSDPKSGANLSLIFEAGPAPSVAFTNHVDNVRVNNWNEVRELDLTQFGGPGATPCTPITSALGVEYTVDHELLHSWGLSITSAAPTAPGTVIPPLPVSATARGAAGTHNENTTTWDSCSYRASLSSRRALTDGENDDSTNTSLVTFCM